MLFTASAGSTAVNLAGTAGFQYIGLDNVVVDPAGVAPIPEPVSVLSTIAGLALLARRARRLR
jgi:hypothetical protein